MRLSISVPITRATRAGVSIPVQQPSTASVWAGRRVGGVWLTASTVLHLPTAHGPRR